MFCVAEEDVTFIVLLATHAEEGHCSLTPQMLFCVDGSRSSVQRHLSVEVQS